MRLTNATGYALAALVYLARHGDGRLLSASAIAKVEGLPEKFLLKVLKPLVGAGVLHSARGPGGGYLLARPAKGITLLEVMEAVQGPVRGEAPAVGTSAEARRLDVQLQATCEKAAETVRGRLRRVSLADLAAE
jgi:Rrf2 family protein